MNPLRLARTHAGALAVLAALVAAAALLVAALPKMMEAAYDRAFAHSVGSASADWTDLTVEYSTQDDPPEHRTAADFARRDERLREILPPVLRRMVGPGHQRASTFNLPVMKGPAADGPLFVDPTWVSGVEQRIRYVAGRPPGASDGRRFELAIVRSAAEAMNIRVGTRLQLGTVGVIDATVTGLFDVTDPGDRFWDHNRAVRAVNRVPIPGSDIYELHVDALISPESLPVLGGGERQIHYAWVIPVDTARATARDAPALPAAIAEYDRLAGVEAADPWNRFVLITRLPELLGRFLGELATAQTVMTVVLGGLLAVSLCVVLLAVQLMVERTDRALALARARGGSLRQVAGAGTGLVALAALPAAPAGYGLSYAVPGPLTPIVHAGPALIAAAVVAGAAALLAARHRAPLHERRADVVAARLSPARITAEAAVVALALGGAFLLRLRGLAVGDPFLVLVPFGLTVAVAVITVRCYPFPLRLLVRLAARRRRAVPFLGLTLAARARSFSVLPVLVLLPALAVSVFSAVVASGITTAQEHVAWNEVGAHARLQASGVFSPEAVERVRRVPGVKRVVPAQIATVRIAERHPTLVAIDLEAYRAIVAGTPLRPPGPLRDGPGIPALVPPDQVGAELTMTWNQQVKLRPQGSVTSFPGLGDLREFVVTPLDVRARMGREVEITTLFVEGDGVAAADLARAAGAGVRVRTFGDALRAIEDEPLTATVQVVFRVVTLALGGYALAAVVLALVVGARERARALSFLRTLGLSAGQARRLTVLEVTPMILLTALAGLGLGLGLEPALGPAIDLSAYAGGAAVAGTEVWWPLLLAATLALMSVLGVYVHIWLGRRAAVGAILRVNE
ncbi:FtsX-like permease family protein [Nonomuraea sp. NPDC050540]|uniref:FtsX-like permease family protein n=1 Tax=Nonomuraea sp. NPDC050540 TaxID=3364367 RepID=UPI00379E13E8